MLQYVVMASLIQFVFTWCKSLTLQLAKAPPHTHTHTRTITEPPPCFMVGVRQGVSALSPHIEPPIWPKDFGLRFAYLKDYSIALLSSLCVPWPTGAFCGFLTAILPYRPASQSLLLTVNVDTLFSPTLVQLCSDVWNNKPFVTQTGDSDELVLCSCCRFWSTSPTFHFVLPGFQMSPNNIMHWKISLLEYLFFFFFFFFFLSIDLVFDQV